MEAKPSNFPIWKYVLSVADSLTDDNRKGQVEKIDVIRYLETIEETFGKSKDPIIDFEGFVLLELCKSLRQALEKV